MALTTTRRYRANVTQMPSGQVITLPGDDVFNMPHGLPSEIDIYDIDTTQRYPLGTKLEQANKIFRYVEFGGTTKAGDLVQTEATDAAHDVLDPSGTGTGAGVAAGSKIISTADTITLVQDEYAGGQMMIEDGAGTGYNYMIESNDDAASNALFRIKHGLAVAITSTTNVRLVKSKYKELLICPTTLTGLPVGVGVGVGADGSFGWMVTQGTWSVLTNGTLLLGRMVSNGVTTAGSVDTYPITLSEAAPNTYVPGDSMVIGVCADVGATTAHSLIDIQLE